jgi:hypothetical protein
MHTVLNIRCVYAEKEKMLKAIFCHFWNLFWGTGL